MRMKPPCRRGHRSMINKCTKLTVSPPPPAPVTLSPVTVSPLTVSPVTASLVTVSPVGP